jgi:hypothetical protein
LCGERLKSFMAINRTFQSYHIQSFKGKRLAKSGPILCFYHGVMRFGQGVNFTLLSPPGNGNCFFLSVSAAIRAFVQSKDGVKMVSGSLWESLRDFARLNHKQIRLRIVQYLWDHPLQLTSGAKYNETTRYTFIEVFKQAQGTYRSGGLVTESDVDTAEYKNLLKDYRKHLQQMRTEGVFADEMCILALVEVIPIHWHVVAITSEGSDDSVINVLDGVGCNGGEYCNDVVLRVVYQQLHFYAAIENKLFES